MSSAGALKILRDGEQHQQQLYHDGFFLINFLKWGRPTDVPVKRLCAGLKFKAGATAEGWKNFGKLIFYKET
ncbi:uncharacterized protein PHALS_12568 [Plasmopara halstedii]|uniref:Uncharacterized protein n=1 Tax=Plasmopara halstedii TaxID=4781 RepID=A0A0P1AND1_PLAHL|nr:uncharacterized protein PHALS_12568 [Plasmopara halstedii]CEG42280.1 hypothetical protein PHALS_12568 [Plasmopara halstedii]|eukprot:XP_024578649.1 hypothetical protein PHALS_12568 [Plasmopara halstedii]